MARFLLTEPLKVGFKLFFKPLGGALFIAALAISGIAYAEINDTGQTSCYNAAGTVVACSTVAGDGRYGRDAAATAGQLPKTGAGAAGFDFTKVANNGNNLVVGAALGNGLTDWACSRDNVTGLVWEMKVNDAAHLRHTGHKYTWYSTAANNGGNAGGLGANNCNGTLAGYANQCNTTNYVAAVNVAKLCGFTDWRLPSLKELQSIVHFGAVNPAIDATYFPNTQTSAYWTATNYAADPANAWVVSFFDGYPFAYYKSLNYYVRLVRGGQ